MFSGVCGESGPFDFGSPCIRASWGAFVPAVFVFGLCFLSSPLFGPFRKNIGSHLKPFLTVQEAEALCGDETIRRDDEREVVVVERLSRWHTVVFVATGLLECLSWTIFGAFQLYEGPTNVWVASVLGVRVVALQCRSPHCPTYRHLALRPVRIVRDSVFRCGPSIVWNVI
jgi:hypothetical protein